MFVEHKIIIKNFNCVHCLFYLYFNTGYLRDFEIKKISILRLVEFLVNLTTMKI